MLIFESPPPAAMPAACPIPIESTGVEVIGFGGGVEVGTVLVGRIFLEVDAIVTPVDVLEELLFFEGIVEEGVDVDAGVDEALGMVTTVPGILVHTSKIKKITVARQIAKMIFLILPCDLFFNIAVSLSNILTCN